MRTIWLVIKHEIYTTLRKRSFWVMTFIMPAILLAFNTYAVIQDSDIGGSEESEAESGPASLPAIGLVDDAGLLKEMPESFPQDLFTPFADEAAAMSALEAGDLEQIVHVPADYLATGEILVYDQEFKLMSSGDDMGIAFGSSSDWVLPYLINYNLSGDESLTVKLRNPTPGSIAEHHVVRPTADAIEGDERVMAEIIARAMPYIYYFILIISSGYMLTSVTAEKENRTVEVLLLSLNPRQLMLGKIIGLTVVVLVQMSVWFAGGALTVGQSSSLLNISAFDFPPGFFIWATLFMLGGYLLYASVMAAVGAIANTAREGNQITWILILPLMPTLMFADKFLTEPNGTLSMVLSMFPFSAPSAMVTRLAVADVPLWQLGVSLGGLALTAYLMIMLASRFFRPHHLLSKSKFNWRRFAAALRG